MIRTEHPRVGAPWKGEGVVCNQRLAAVARSEDMNAPPAVSALLGVMTLPLVLLLCQATVLSVWGAAEGGRAWQTLLTVRPNLQLKHNRRSKGP